MNLVFALSLSYAIRPPGTPVWICPCFKIWSRDSSSFIILRVTQAVSVTSHLPRRRALIIGGSSEIALGIHKSERGLRFNEESYGGSPDWGVWEVGDCWRQL